MAELTAKEALNKIEASLSSIVAGGGRRGDSAKLAKEGLDDVKKLNTASKKELELKIDAYRQAQRQYKKGEKEYELLEDRIKVQRELLKANEEFVDGIKKVGDSFVGLGKAAFEGEGSISAFTDNIKGLGLIGNRLDVNIETFRQLSQTGASFGKSIVELRNSAGEAALPLDDFAKLVASNSSNLAAMFGTTTKGAREIATLGRITREVGMDRLAPLGFTVDEVNETLLLNLDSQRRSGILDRLTRDEQRDSAINFAEQLDRLAKLTGQQRDELRKQIEQQQSNERFAIAMQNQTDETRQRLQGFAATVGNIAPGLNEGFQDLIANAGRPVTDSAIALIQNIPEAQGIIQKLISGQISSEEALGQIRNASITSMNRFGKATVTGQVEFLRLQGDVINLGRRIVDVDGVYKDQNASATSLVSNLTTFEQATKVLSSQFQGIETSLLKAFGPALGGIIEGVQGLFAKGGSLATAMAKAPTLTAGLIAGALTGKFLFNKAVQIGMIAAGTRLGTAHLQWGGSSMGMLAKGGMKTAGKAVGGAAGLGMGIGGAAQAYSAETKGGKAMGIGSSVLGGALTGFMMGGPWGAAIGALGGLAVGGISAYAGRENLKERSFGGDLAGAKSFLTHKQEFLDVNNPKITGQVTAKKDIKEILNTEKMEKELSQISAFLRDEAKVSAQRLDALNTSNMLQSKIKVAAESTARQDRNRLVSS